MTTKAAEYSRRYRERHGDEIRERARGSYQAQQKWREANPEYAWAYQLRKFHKMTPADYEQMWERQHALCYLCEEPLERGKVHIDHDHACCREGRSCVLCRRGLACRGCNWILGWCQDDPEKLRRIASNLESLPR